MLDITIQIKPLILLIIVITLMILGIIISKTNENIGYYKEIRAFKGMLVSYMAYALVDLRLLNDHFYVTFPKIVTLFIMALGFAAMSCSCYFWFLYVFYSAKLQLKTKKVWLYIVSIPFIFDLLMLFTPLQSFLFEITDVPAFKPALFAVIMMDYIYLIIATVISVNKRIHARNNIEKRKYSGQAMYIIFFTLSGFIVGFLMNLPAIELCVLPVVVKLFSDLQDSKIYTDALTNLNNRRRINEYINEELLTCSEENPLTIIMIDLDFFKNINDILGHDEGDKALIAFSNALSHCVSTKNALAARWGGDEFIVAGKEKDFAGNFREELATYLNQSNELAFTPMFSIGTYICTSSSMKCEQALAEADSNLYKDKSIQHQNAKEFLETLEHIKS